MFRSFIEIIINHKTLYWTFLCILTAGLVYFLLHDKGDLIMYLNANRSDFFDWFNVNFTYLGEAGIYIIGIIIFLFYRYSWSLGVAVVGLSSILVSSSLKVLFAERRPWRWLGENNMHGLVDHIPGNDFHVGLSSFPSGHTLAAFAFYTFLALIFPRYKYLLITIAVLVGFTRLYLMQHFIEDVLFGATLGIILGTMGFAFISTLDGKWLDNIRS